ncbi:TetR family transcriptional regulator [Lysinibacillus sp. KU-BSD001]|uniref:TetR family transcriptional regulator n=1 Tax=Lysinibacillus sp. KU-BSD001 TaxID=3141328 RepID=UPI0036EFEF81
MDKQQRIINAAIKLFKDKGIEGTKISDITKEAHIALGTYYLYFPSKLALMPAITNVMIQDMMQAITQNVPETAPIDKKLEILVDTVFAVTKDQKQLVKIIYTGLSASDYLADWVNAYIPYYDWLTKQLELAIQNNEIDLPIETMQTSKILYGLIESAAERAYLFDEKNEELIVQDKQDVLCFINKVMAR